MKKGNGYFSRLALQAVMADENITKQPLMELWAGRRVLIENHEGVSAYSMERIRVQTKLGVIQVSGEGMKICTMTNQQLVITGKIHQITLERSERL